MADNEIEWVSHVEMTARWREYRIRWHDEPPAFPARALDAPLHADPRAMMADE